MLRDFSPQRAKKEKNRILSPEYEFSKIFDGDKMIDHNALVSAMMSYSEQQFIRSLRMEPEARNMQVSLTLKRYLHV